MSASLLRTYADNPGPTVTIEQGKRFPFLNHFEVGNENGKMLYPKWELFGDFVPPQPIAANDCQDVLLQAGDRVPQSSGTRTDQGGPIGKGGQPGKGGPDHDPGHDQGTGVPSQFETPLNECEFEHVNEILNLVEIWADRPTLNLSDQQWSLRCVHDMVVQPGTTQSVTVRWPVLSASEFDELSQHKMLLEICGAELGVTVGKDVSNPHLVGGIGPLRIDQQAKACLKLLFRNPTEKRVTILGGDTLGYAKLAGQGYINPEWYHIEESRNLVN